MIKYRTIVKRDKDGNKTAMAINPIAKTSNVVSEAAGVIEAAVNIAPAASPEDEVIVDELVSRKSSKRSSKRIT